MPGITDLHHIYIPETASVGASRADAHNPVRHRTCGLPRSTFRKAWGGRPFRLRHCVAHHRYDPQSDMWRQRALMITPRYATGSATIGDWIYAAGGAPMTGGSVQSAVNEAFTLGQPPRFARSGRIVVQPRRSGTSAASTGVAGSKPTHAGEIPQCLLRTLLFTE
jgi:hypothetical protein